MDIKKILLSLAFIAVFGIYVIYERTNSNSNNNPLPNSNPSALNLPSDNHNQTSAQNITYKNGTYTGSSANAFYGTVQVQAIISGGKLTDIKILNYPQDRQHSIQVSNYSLPQLKTEAIQSQSASVDVISGATATSQAFMQSLSSALSQAS